LTRGVVSSSYKNMSDPTLKQLLWLGLAWAAWAALHSLLLWEPLRGRLGKAFGWSGNLYRACYSGLAFLTILPVAWYARGLEGFSPFFWPWPWLLIQSALITLAVFIMVWAWRSFKTGGVDLLGWEDAAAHHHEPPHLVTSGAYAWSRHPMYLAAAIVLWARNISTADLVTNAVLTIYLILGSWHEESRMGRAFGRQWDEYSGKVPVFINWRRPG
jgi:protein-S-isoprenylcysteine O-methyltransferase Ste14